MSLLVDLPTNARLHIPKAYNSEASGGKTVLTGGGEDVDEFSTVSSSNAFTFVISTSVILAVSVLKYLRVTIQNLSINVRHR